MKKPEVSIVLSSLVALAVNCSVAAQIPPPFDQVVPTPVGNEAIYVQTPQGTPTASPLIVVFHGAYYDNHWKHAQGTRPLQRELLELMTEAAGRKWYVVSMTGGPNRFSGTYASDKVHARTTAAIQWMMQNYSIDPERIYTLGYSMGGVDATNYAARHLDPNGIRIAATWCWSGALCADVSLGTGNCHVVPCNPLARIAASTVQTASCNCNNPSGSFVSDESLGWNLENVPIVTTQATNDLCDDVICPAPAFNSLTAGWLAPFANHTHLTNYGSVHWDASQWKARTICDFFDPYRVSTPNEATLTVAVEDTRYFWFDVARDDPQKTATFGWKFTGQTLDVNQILRAGALQVDIDGGVDCPLDSQSTITINMTPQAGFTTGTLMVLNNLPQSVVTGITLNGGSAANKFTWLTPTRLVLFKQQGSGTLNWVISI